MAIANSSFQLDDLAFSLANENLEKPENPLKSTAPKPKSDMSRYNHQ